ncbi:MAG: hypothetical protein ACTTID_02610 [Bacillales bacterium]
MKKEETVVLINDENEEFEMRALFTYYNPDRDCEYIFLYQEINDEDVFVFKDDGKNGLIEVEDIDEFNEAMEVFNAFNEEQIVKENK